MQPVVVTFLPSYCSVLQSFGSGPPRRRRMAPQEGQIRHEIQGNWCFPLPLHRVLRWESVPQSRGEMWQYVGVGVG